jgi:Na+/melibiose symporter-like transporter
MITLFGWRSIFLINVPIGIFATIWGYRRLREVGVKAVGEKFDWAGSILYCVALSIVLWALAVGDPTSPGNLIILAAGFVLFGVAIVVERRQKYPTLDLSLFKIRLFAAGNVSSFLNSVAFSCGPFLRSLYLQLILGYSALKAGVSLIPMEVVVLAISPISGRLADRYGSRVLASVGLAINASALFWFSTLNQNSAYSAVLVSLLLFGLGRALFISPNSSAVMGSVPAQRRGVANGVRMTLTQTGNALSIPLSLLLMTLVMPYARLSQIVSSSQLISSDELPIFLRAINHACLILGVIIVIAIIPSLLRGPRSVSTKTPS